MVEIWKDIKDYENSYTVSNKGNVINKRSGKKLKGSIDSVGYPKVALCVNSKVKEFRIHRLVGFAFVDGYFSGAIINHKDSDKTNNIFTNLEWTDKSGNQKHAIKSGMFKPPVMFGKNNKNSKRVIDIKTGVIYECVRMAAESIKISQSYLSQMLRGDRNNKTNLEYMGNFQKFKK
jgi:hypothetical protein